MKNMYLIKNKYLINFTSFLLLFVNITIFANPTKKSELVFSNERGFYYEEFVLEIRCEITDAKIKYTLDGTNPAISKTAIVQNSPASILINPLNTSNRDYAPGFIITACATFLDTLVTDIVTQTYLFPDKINSLSRDNVLPGAGWLPHGMAHYINYGMDPDVYNNISYSAQIKDGFQSIPTLSLTTDLKSLFDSDNGIYVNSLFHGKEWERNASLELLNPDDSEGFQINCGIRIRGGWSRHFDNPKHAFRFFFDEEYGENKLKYPLFGNEGTDEFDKIDLRTAQNYSWSYYGDQSNTFLRDVFSRDTQRDMNQPYTRSRFYHLFINGTYWGLYQTQERSEASFAKSYFGGNAKDYDVIKVDVGEDFDLYHVEATDGTLDKWKELWDAGQKGFSDDESYFKIQGLNTDLSPNSQYEKLLDVDNLIDYMIITFFTGDFDGPISGFRNNNSPNNFYAIYNRVNPDGFKFFRHDAEHTLLFNNMGIDRTGPYAAGQYFEDSNPQWIHQKLSENNNYRLRFADRAYKHFFNNGALTQDNNRKRILDRKAQIETAIVAESARWGDSKSYTPRTKTDWNNAINFILNDYLPTRNNVVINQLKNKQLYSDLTPPQFSAQAGIISKGTEISISIPNGEIYYTTDGSDPYSPVSSSTSFSKPVISASSTKRILVPTSEQSNAWKTDLDYDDSNWIICNGSNGGVGYDNGGDYNQFISLDVKFYMFETSSNPNNSCYIRIPFNIDSEDFIRMNFMNLDIMVDDGFVAYLNGVKVAEYNSPTPLTWNSASSTFLEANSFERFELNQYLNILNDGENILSIHGLNVSPQSSDFLILPILTIGNSSMGGSVSPNANLYINPIKIEETTTLKARSLINSKWSALSESKFIINENLSNLKITELHYHPLDQITGQDTVDGKEFEFIELKNIGTSELNLTESSFINGISFTFPQGSILDSKGFSIIASNSEEFNNRYGFLPDGEFIGQLDNSGEKIVFNNAANDTVLNFSFNDKLPWPEEADGDGYSLVSETRNPTGDPNNASYWVKSESINGSPGVDDLISNIIGTDGNTPNDFMLYQNYPNPFNPTTYIKYSLPFEGKVELKIFDILGREIATLINTVKKVGNYGLNISGENLSSGIYFYRLQSGDFTKSMKMILLK